MSQRANPLIDTIRWLLVAAVLGATSTAATAQVVPAVQPPFDEDFALIDLGAVEGVHLPYGGVAFVPGDPDAILIVGYSGAEIATIYTAALMRDSTGSIAGFAGPAVPAVQAYAAGGGMGHGPGGVLFYSRVTKEMGEVKPGSAVTDKVVDLGALFWNPGGLNFVPPGLGDAGTLKIVTYAYGEWWSATLAPDQNGTYDLTSAVKGPSLQGYPTGFTYIAPGTPGPLGPGLLVCEHELSYGAGKVVRYDVDQHSNPVVATRQVMVAGLDVPEGIAVDPITGDVLFVSYQGRVHHLRSAPLPPTTTTVTTTSSTTSTSTSTSTSSSTTTSTTVPTTTSTTTNSTTVPTTSPTSTLPPTTTSSTHPTSTTSSTTTTSPAPTTSSTTTTLPSACGIDPSFEWIGCRVGALLALVRASSELGTLQATLVARLEQAQDTLAKGATSCAGGERATARRALDRLAHQMVLLRARTRSLRARKTMPRPLADLLGNEARGIAADARALRAALECP